MQAWKTSLEMTVPELNRAVSVKTQVAWQHLPHLDWLLAGSRLRLCIAWLGHKWQEGPDGGHKVCSHACHARLRCRSGFFRTCRSLLVLLQKRTNPYDALA